MARVGRLTRRQDYLRLTESGRSIVTAAFVFSYMPAPDGVRVGYTASRKIGTAVDRNRARRRLKALVARAPEGIAPADIVFIARAAVLNRPLEKMLADLGRCLAESGLKADGGGAA
jgi:ribonuclease P protein component